MSLSHKAADMMASVSFASGVASAVHWLVGDLAPLQILGIIVGVAAGVMAILSHWKNWRRR